MDFLSNGTCFENVTDSLVLEDDEDYNYRKYLKRVCDIMTVIVLVLIMFAMGTDISLRQIWNHLKLPIGVIIGMVCQFIVMPLLGFAISKALDFTGAYAIGLLLISCCPGGAVSNIFSYYLDGDIPLSVTMTSMSTLLDLGFMPLNFWIYGRFVDVGELVIPYKDMATSLAFVTSPVGVGILTRWRFPKAAPYITKVGSLVSLFTILVIVIMQNIAYPHVLIGAPWKLFAAVLLMPSCGFVIGYCLAWIFRRTADARKTIAVECGIQNVAIAMAVLALSPFSFEAQASLMLFPMMYGISMISICVIVCSLYQLWNRVLASAKADITKDSSKCPS